MNIRRWLDTNVYECGSSLYAEEVTTEEYSHNNRKS